MLLISQNLSTFNMAIPEETVFRVNLAWVTSLEEISLIVQKHRNHTLLLDFPIKRIKPPSNSWKIMELIPLIESHRNIQYVAISNVESASDLEEYIKSLPKEVIIIPKIESVEGIDNLPEITSLLEGQMKFMMLDHDDLFMSINNAGGTNRDFIQKVNHLVDYCKQQGVKLLRAKGVIFSDE